MAIHEPTVLGLGAAVQSEPRTPSRAKILLTPRDRAPMASRDKPQCCRGPLELSGSQF